tara:strand:- start:289 stop:1092 length:804 start_codon:yes stop_codon:yes gene_type:complete
MNYENRQLRNNCKKLIFDAVRNAGKIALEFDKKKINFWYKSKNQPVTDADIKINDYLKSFLQNKYPDFGWLSEETVDDGSRKMQKSFWCLDPIDGTRSFLNHKPEFTISLALLYESTPVFGVIHNPKTKELFYAEKNNGAFCNNKKMKVNNKINIKDCNLGISNSEFENLKNFPNLKNLKILRMGSIAYKIALVAKGKIDISLSLTKKSDWDLAAAALILEEAGGMITEKNGKPINYNTNNLEIPSVIASNSQIHKKMINHIKAYEK